MTKKRLLFIFGFAGLIFALIAGVYVYQLNRAPSEAEIRALLGSFTEKIASLDMDGARSCLTEDSRNLLRDPGTLLGETLYRKLKLKSVENIFAEGNGAYAADVILTGPDTLTIMTKAGMLFAERITEEGPADDPDQLMAAIYEEILSREDLPMTDRFCVIRLEVRDGKLQIKADEALRQVLEGNSEAVGSALDQFAR